MPVLVITATIVVAALALLFTGAAIVERWRTIRRERRVAALEAGWEPPVLEVLGGRRRADSVAGLVRRQDALDFLEFLSRLARRLPDRERGPLVALAAPCLDDAAPSLDHPDEAVRVRAIQTISLLAFEAHATRILRALDDPSSLVALVAARAVARRDRPDLAPLVIRRLGRFAHWHAPLVSAVVAELGLDAASALLEAYADPGQPAAVRAILADALCRLRAPGAADVAARLLGPGRNPELVAASLRVLRDLGERRHLPAIRDLLTSDHEAIRTHAIAAFGALADAEELRALVPALDDPSPWVAREAARALRSADGGKLLRARADAPDAPAVVAEVLAEAPW